MWLIAFLVSAASAHVLITTYGPTNLAASPLCRSVGAMPFDCTVATVGPDNAQNPCTALAHCAFMHVEDSGSKDANIRVQEAVALQNASWLLVITPTYRLASGWADDTARMVGALESEENPDGVCMFGACIFYHGVLEHVNHKALYSARCYHRLLPAANRWDEPTDVAFTNAILASDARLVCEPRFNGHLMPAADDIFFRTDGWHHMSRVVGEFPDMRVVLAGASPY